MEQIAFKVGDRVRATETVPMSLFMDGIYHIFTMPAGSEGKVVSVDSGGVGIAFDDTAIILGVKLATDYLTIVDPAPVASEPAEETEIERLQDELKTERLVSAAAVTDLIAAKKERDILAAALVVYSDSIKFNGWDWVSPDDGTIAEAALNKVTEQKGNKNG